MRLHRTIGLFATVALALPAFADAKYVVRLATAAPDGTAWAHEMKAFAREVETESAGAVKVKWYFGGIAGDEVKVRERMERGQLDGVASGGVLCQDTAPSLRVISVRGLFSSRAESAFIMNKLKPVFEVEARKNGYEYVAATGLGPALILSRNPVTTMDEIKKVRVWQWTIDRPGDLMNRELGMSAVLLPIEEALLAYDEGRIDGFIANPSGAVAFQWFSRARYVLNLPLAYVWGCLMMTTRSLDRLPADLRGIVQSTAVKMAARIDDAGRKQDEQLMGGLFEKQGLKAINPSDQLRREFWSAARAARDRLVDKLVPASLLQQVMAALADYRSEHANP